MVYDIIRLQAASNIMQTVNKEAIGLSAELGAAELMSVRNAVAEANAVTAVALLGGAREPKRLSTNGNIIVDRLRCQISSSF